MQEGIQLPELLARIKVLREAGLRAEHVAFSFMKRRIQPLMARETLGFEYTGDDDSSRMPGGELDDNDIVERLSRTFKDMPPYTACPIEEYSAARPPKEVSSRTPPSRVVIACSEVADVPCLVQDDVKRFISEPQPPPSEIEIPMEGKAKERREVSEGHDTVVVEDSSEDDDEDEETLQDRFQLRSRFSRPGLPHVPLVQDPPASLEASLVAAPRKPRNPARKRVTKKLKVSETTPQEVSCLEQSSRVLVV
jgi:hypothetical protein